MVTKEARTKSKRRGFIALHRAVFDHPLFKNERPFTRLQAWVWLISEAAWRKSERRVGLIEVKEERGQLAASTRGLAKDWGWHESKVRRFLAALCRQEMVFLSLTTGAQADAAPDAEADAAYPHRITLITICNYRKFNDQITGTQSHPTQYPTQRPTNNPQQMFDFEEEIVTEQLNKLTKETTVRELVERGGRGEARKRPETCPRDGATNGKVIFARVGGAYWDCFAADYRAVTGAEPLPKMYPCGNGGRWFNRNGEAAPSVRTGLPILPARGGAR
jgi:hypothetical protein